MIWLPEILTLGGIFPIGLHGVVGVRVSYTKVSRDVACESIFSGEVCLTLTSRELAELYVTHLNGAVRINYNQVPVKVEFSRYFLSTKDVGFWSG